MPIVNFNFDNRGVPAKFSALELHKAARHDKDDFRYWESANGEFIDNELRQLLRACFTSYKLERHAHTKVFKDISELPQLGWTTTQMADHLHRVIVAAHIYK